MQNKHSDGHFLMTNEAVVEAFFNTYPHQLCEQKLNDFYRIYVLANAEEDGKTIATDLLFYKDLMAMLQEVRTVLAQAKYLPIQLEPLFCEETITSLQGIVNLLKEAIPIGLIYNLSRSKDELDLMIVLEKSCVKPYEEFDGITALTALGYKVANCTIHNHGLLYKLLKQGHIFYNTACIESNLIYKKSTEELWVEIDSTLFEAGIKEAKILFESGMAKAKHFYCSAQHFIADEVYDMAMFMLQQTCELTYRCLLKVLRSRDVKCHSPIVLRKHIKRFAPEVIGVFSAQEEEEIAYLQLLEEAYVKARYTQQYTVEQSLISQLNQGVGLLQQKAKNLFNNKIQVLSKQMALSI